MSEESEEYTTSDKEPNSSTEWTLLDLVEDVVHGMCASVIIGAASYLFLKNS